MGYSGYSERFIKHRQHGKVKTISCAISAVFEKRCAELKHHHVWDRADDVVTDSNDTEGLLKKFIRSDL